MLFLIGALAGLAYGLSAFGGSLLAVALLVLILAMPITTAMSMNLCMLVVLATITAGDGIRARLPVPGLIWPYALTAGLCAPLGMLASLLLGDMALGQIYALLLAVVAAALVALLLWRQMEAEMLPRGGLAALAPAKPDAETRHALRPGLVVFGGGLGGLLAGFAGASAALLLTPAFARLFAEAGSQVKGRATACAEMAVLPALVISVVVSIASGRGVAWHDTGFMIFGALAGLSVARMLAPRASARVWHALLAAALMLVVTALWLRPA